MSRDRAVAYNVPVARGRARVKKKAKPSPAKANMCVIWLALITNCVVMYVYYLFQIIALH